MSQPFTTPYEVHRLSTSSRVLSSGPTTTTSASPTASTATTTRPSTTNTTTASNTTTTTSPCEKSAVTSMSSPRSWIEGEQRQQQRGAGGEGGPAMETSHSSDSFYYSQRPPERYYHEQRPSREEENDVLQQPLRRPFKTKQSSLSSSSSSLPRYYRHNSSFWVSYASSPSLLATTTTAATSNTGAPALPLPAAASVSGLPGDEEDVITTGTSESNRSNNSMLRNLCSVLLPCWVSSSGTNRVGTTSQPEDGEDIGQHESKHFNSSSHKSKTPKASSFRHLPLPHRQRSQISLTSHHRSTVSGMYSSLEHVRLQSERYHKGCISLGFLLVATVLALALAAVALITVFLIYHPANSNDNPVTSCDFARYVSQEDLDTGRITMPDPFQQCACHDEITVLPQYVRDQYHRLKQERQQRFSDDDIAASGDPISSCQLSNVALVWVSMCAFRHTEETKDNSTTTAAEHGGHSRLWNRYTLAHLFASFHGHQWNNRTNWVTGTDECTWHGIECAEESTTATSSTIVNITMLQSSVPVVSPPPPSIIGISLSGNQLAGTWNREMSNLMSRLGPQPLLRLDLSDNQIQGPATIPTVASLQTLDVSNNHFTAPMDPSMSSWSQSMVHLRHLDISSNDLQGTLPSVRSLASQLTNLQHLNVSQNERLESDTGSTEPTEAAQRFVPLQRLDCSGTRIGGTLSGQIVPQMTNLTILELNEMRLRGTLPSEIGQLMKLETVRMVVNEITGTLPSELGLLSKLTRFELNMNQIQGTIPEQLGDLTALTVLSLVGNQLSGTIPTTIGELTNLKRVGFGNNMGLTGTLPEEELLRLTNLEVLDISKTLLVGTISNQLCALVSKRLRYPCTVTCECCPDFCTR